MAKALMGTEEANAEAVRRITTLPTNLRWLDLGDLPLLAVPKEIEKLKQRLNALSLGAYKITIAGTKLFREYDHSRPFSMIDLTNLAKLTRLNYLDLSNCNQLWDIRALANLTKLNSLYLGFCTWLSDVKPLAKLTRLNYLDLSNCNQLWDIRALANLTKLTSLYLSWCEQLSDVRPIAKLTNLAYLNMSNCDQLSDVKPLAKLTNLAYLSLRCCDQLSDVGPLAKLTKLAKLNMGGCAQLSDVKPLAKLTKLTTLSLSCCDQLSDVGPLAKLTNLAYLNLSYCRQLSDVGPLVKLTKLTTLELNNCRQLSDVGPLVKLTKLTTLELNNCHQLSDVKPIAKLTKLKSLDLSWCSATAFAPLIPLLGKLTDLWVFGNPFIDLHPAVCGDSHVYNAIDSVRQYYAALGTERKPDAEIKVFVLGNGGAGKSFLVERLKGHSFDAIERSGLGSTHGVRIEPHDLPVEWKLPHPVRLVFWDFGGQDIYHGTHALFLKEPAIYILLYSKDSENEGTIKAGQFEMHNRLLSYWYDYLRQEAGTNGVVKSPVLLVQSQCDTASRPFDVPPDLPPAGMFENLIRVDSSSSKEEGGLHALSTQLRYAVKELLRQHPQPPFPTSWAKVRDDIRKRQKSEKQPTLTQTEFAKLCKKHGCESHAGVLRDALHQMGVIFYRTGLLEGQIVIIQKWVLDKIYTIFDRTKTEFQAEVRDKGGKFRRKDLERFFWPNNQEPLASQRLYLSFMEQSGICFRTVQDYKCDYEGMYIAPDLLPKWDEGPSSRFEEWRKKPDAGVNATYTLLHDGISRGFLSRIGQRAGDRAEYWRYGCHFFDATTMSEVLIRTEGNSIRMEARDGDATRLLQTLMEILDRVPFGQPPIVVWDKQSASQREREQRSEHDPAEKLNPAVMTQLERLGWEKASLYQLRTFYLIGRAFKAGLHSFRSIENDFKDRSSKNSWPNEYSISANGMSGTLRKLAKNVFTKQFKKRKVSLYRLVANKTGMNAVLTADGLRAWEETRDFLKRRKEPLPKW